MWNWKKYFCFCIYIIQEREKVKTKKIYKALYTEDFDDEEIVLNYK